MKPEKFFKEMYYNIWQSHDLKRISEFYSEDFEETISTSDEYKKPIELHLTYADLVKQAHWQQQHYRDTTLDIRKITVSADDHIAVVFYSSSIDKKTGELRHRHVSGIWRLNQVNKIDYVWAVVTPYYRL